jgi:ribonuclease VapC
VAFEVVLDSSAIIAIFKQEPGYEGLERKIDEAHSISIGAPTVVETAMVLTRITASDQSAALEAYLRRIDARVVAFTETHYMVAIRAFARFGRGFQPA